MDGTVIIGSLSLPAAAAAQTPWWEQPAVSGAIIAGLVAGAGIVVNFLLGHQLQKQRLTHEKELADKRFTQDAQLAEKKHELDAKLADRRLEAETELAKRKSRLDMAMEQWRRRITWVEETLAEFYTAANIITQVRFPGAFGEEAEARPGRDHESADLKAYRDTYYPVLKRLQDNADFLNALHAKRFQAVAMFGAGASEPFNRLHQVVVSVTVAAQSLMRANTHQPIGTMPAFKEKMEKRVWEGLEDPDPIVAEMQAVLAKADEVFGGFLNDPTPEPKEEAKPRNARSLPR